GRTKLLCVGVVAADQGFVSDRGEGLGGYRELRGRADGRAVRGQHVAPGGGAPHRRGLRGSAWLLAARARPKCHVQSSAWPDRTGYPILELPARSGCGAAALMFRVTTQLPAPCQASARIASHRQILLLLAARISPKVSRLSGKKGGVPRALGSVAPKGLRPLSVDQRGVKMKMILAAALAIVPMLAKDSEPVQRLDEAATVFSEVM